MKRTILTLVAGIAVGAAVVAAPALGSHHGAKRYIYARPGDTLTVGTLDLYCSLWRSDPDGHLTGPIIYCSRKSVSTHSWSVTVSRRWIQIGNPQGHLVWQHARLP